MRAETLSQPLLTTNTSILNIILRFIRPRTTQDQAHIILGWQTPKSNNVRYV
jgi:hypothetical protein